MSGSLIEARRQRRVREQLRDAITEAMTIPAGEAQRGTMRVRLAISEAESLLDYVDGLEAAMRLIRDGRCSCGGRFKWTGSQTRCEQCGTHQGYGYGHATGIAKEALRV